MYWYISFLRPPSISAEAGSSTTITPQVANDLRTELRYETTELYYQWQRCEPSLVLSLPACHLVNFTPPESTYRPIHIPLPSQARIGEKWRLCLSTTGSSSNPTSADGAANQDILALTGSSSECIPISVYSEGIEIIRPNPAQGGVTRGLGGQSGKSRGKGKEKVEEREKSKGKGKEKDEGPKQTRIRREWETPAGLLRIVEQTSFDLDKKIWDSGLALSSWLYRHLMPSERAGIIAGTSKISEQPAEELVRDVLDLLKTSRSSLDVLELGSGTGLVSIALHAIKTKLGHVQSRIVATDLESAIPLMEENISLNTPSLTDSGDLKLRADILDWDQPLPLWIANDGEMKDGWPNLIIAADVTYNTASFPSLVKTLKSLLHPPDRKDRPKLLLAYKQREQAERNLWDMLEREGIKMVLVDWIPGAQEDEGRVEIWIGWAIAD